MTELPVGLEVLEVLAVHLETELLLHEDDHVHHFQAVDPEVLLQAGVVRDLRFVNFQLLHEEGFDFLLYFVDIHIT